MCKPSGRPLVHSKTGQPWAALDIPLLLISSHKFSQPIFGANSLGGAAQAIPGGGFSGAHELRWKLTFKNGGVGTFLPIFFRLMEYIKNHMSQQVGEAKEAADGEGEEVGLLNPMQARQIAEGYMDPNDPSHVYMISGHK